jgi:hypothetical protein
MSLSYSNEIMDFRENERKRTDKCKPKRGI